MGSSSSKHARKENRSSVLQRAMSLQVLSRADKRYDQKSAALTVMNDGFVKEGTDDSFSCSASYSKQKKSPTMLNFLIGEDEWEIDEGREQREGEDKGEDLKATSIFKRRTVSRSVSTFTAREVDLHLGKADSPKLPDLQKHLQVHVKEMDEPFIESPMSRYNSFSPSSKLSKCGSEGRDFSSNDMTDDGRNSGLRLLLSPSTLLSSSNLPVISSTLISSPSLNWAIPDCLSASSSSRPKIFTKPTLSDSVVTCGSSWESKGPVLDPVLIATFEKALESVCENNMDLENSSFSCSENISSFSETSSNADSPYLKIPHLEKSACLLTLKHNKISRPSSQEECTRKLPLSKLNKEGSDWRNVETLENYEIKCPHGGGDKVVLYFTSLCVIRKTFEDCQRVRLILRGLRMHVDDRDVSIHCKFRKELTDLLGKGIIAPRLFIKGRYIGGIDEVMQLHEMEFL